MTLKIMLLATLAGMAGLADDRQPAPPVPIGFGADTLKSHIVSGSTRVDVPSAPPRGYRAIGVRVTIAADGSVTGARLADPKERADGTLALAAARKLRFRPLTYRGAPVAAAGIVWIRYEATGGRWRDPKAASPAIDYATLKITLTRSTCFGSCPDYQVTIDGAGNVEFSAVEESLTDDPQMLRLRGPGSGVIVRGVHRTKIDRAALDALIERFRMTRFFGLERNYAAQITDHPTHQIRFETGGHNWTVTDYAGYAAGMPREVTALEEAIDAAAGTARWVAGDAGTVSALLAEGLDPQGAVAQRMALTDVQRGSGQVTVDLIAAGLPLDTRIETHGTLTPLGGLLLEHSIRRSKPQLVAALAARGWLARLDRAELDALFASTAGGCDPAIARAMVAAGADLGARTPASTSTSRYESGRRTAVISVTRSGGCYDNADHGAAVAAALIALGADVNAVDDRGETAIFGAGDLDLVEHLLAAGARVDIKGKDGNSAVFATWGDAIALRLLEAGADPHGYSDQGRKTLRQMSEERDMPAVRAWLDAHRIE